MSAIDLPPGIGLARAAGSAGAFRSPARSRRLALTSVVVTTILGAITWAFVAQHPYRWHASTQFVLPIALVMFAMLGFAVRHARVLITRDGVRWGWTALGFQQSASSLAHVHVYADGIALESKHRASSTWFLAARDWDRFAVLVRQLRRVQLPIVEHAGNAPLRARVQSYGRFLDGLLVLAMVGGAVVLVWSAS